MGTDESSETTPEAAAAFRLRRGALVMGTDGTLGTLHQVIMDQRTCALQALVIEMDDAQTLELSARHVLRGTESTVHTDVSAADLRQHPGLATPHNPNKYVPVSKQPATMPPETGAHEHLVVTNIERDAVGVTLPAASSPASERVGQPETATPERDANLPPRHPAPYPPSALRRTAPLFEPTPENPHETGPATDDATAIAVPVVTPVAPTAEREPRPASAGEGARVSSRDEADGLENATPLAGVETPLEEEEEAAFMEGSEPTVNPVNPGVASDTIYNEEDTAPEVLAESSQGYTKSTPPDVAAERPGRRRGLTSSSTQDIANQLTWVPAVALGALVVGVGVWSTLRAIRRGRRKAAEAAESARLSAEALGASLRDSVRDAGNSAVELAHTLRASAQEIAANPRDSATDAFSRFADIPARYRWFRRGMRVGTQVGRLRRK